MFRVWGKLFKDNRMLKDLTVCDDSQDTRTHKVLHALDEMCYAFDLSKPIWLDSNVREFQRHAKTRFRQDSFVDEIEFDFLEFPGHWRRLNNKNRQDHSRRFLFIFSESSESDPRWKKPFWSQNFPHSRCPA